MNTNIKGTPGNGINVGALREFADQVAAKPAAGIATFGVVTTWEVAPGRVREPCRSY